ISELNIEPAWDYMEEHGIDEIIVHAPYIINLANTVKPETYELAERFLALELERTAACKSRILILHPGAHVGAGVDAGIAQIVRGLNHILTPDTPVCIALETMAGKGSEIGRSFEELARIYDGVTCSDKLRVCFDTCHTSDSGYDIIHDFDGVMEEFDRLIGRDQIAVFHINDSKNPAGAAKDRHANIGFGQIGFDALNYIVHHPDFEDVPKILETPYVPSPTQPKKSFAPYKYEIEMLRQGSFDPDLLEKIAGN
ncbi:MAG TPA: deoxyribonuclease IV, partial [Candidatus Dorea intestinigallinarum]|nr:deoxyribonuclease IV [Candidatus Dorea intestinigallinarum]